MSHAQVGGVAPPRLRGGGGLARHPLERGARRSHRRRRRRAPAAAALPLDAAECVRSHAGDARRFGCVLGTLPLPPPAAALAASGLLLPRVAFPHPSSPPDVAILAAADAALLRLLVPTAAIVIVRDGGGGGGGGDDAEPVLVYVHRVLELLPRGPRPSVRVVGALLVPRRGGGGAPPPDGEEDPRPVQVESEFQLVGDVLPRGGG